MFGSDFYQACHDGDIGRARHALESVNSLDARHFVRGAMVNAIKRGQSAVVEFLLRTDDFHASDTLLEILNGRPRTLPVETLREILWAVLRHSLADAPGMQSLVKKNLLELERNFDVLTPEMLVYCMNTLYPGDAPIEKDVTDQFRFHTCWAVDLLEREEFAVVRKLFPFIQNQECEWAKKYRFPLTWFKPRTEDVLMELGTTQGRAWLVHMLLVQNRPERARELLDSVGMTLGDVDVVHYLSWFAFVGTDECWGALAQDWVLSQTDMTLDDKSVVLENAVTGSDEDFAKLVDRCVAIGIRPSVACFLTAMRRLESNALDTLLLAREAVDFSEAELLGLFQWGWIVDNVEVLRSMLKWGLLKTKHAAKVYDRLRWYKVRYFDEDTIRCLNSYTPKHLRTESALPKHND